MAPKIIKETEEHLEGVFDIQDALKQLVKSNEFFKRRFPKGLRFLDKNDKFKKQNNAQQKTIRDHQKELQALFQQVDGNTDYHSVISEKITKKILEIDKLPLNKKQRESINKVAKEYNKIIVKQMNLKKRVGDLRQAQEKEKVLLDKRQVVLDEFQKKYDELKKVLLDDVSWDVNNPEDLKIKQIIETELNVIKSGIDGQSGRTKLDEAFQQVVDSLLNPNHELLNKDAAQLTANKKRIKQNLTDFLPSYLNKLGPEKAKQVNATLERMIKLQQSIRNMNVDLSHTPPILRLKNATSELNALPKEEYEKDKKEFEKLYLEFEQKKFDARNLPPDKKEEEIKRLNDTYNPKLIALDSKIRIHSKLVSEIKEHKEKIEHWTGIPTYIAEISKEHNADVLAHFNQGLAPSLGSSGGYCAGIALTIAEYLTSHPDATISDLKNNKEALLIGTHSEAGANSSDEVSVPSKIKVTTDTHHFQERQRWDARVNTDSKNKGILIQRMMPTSDAEKFDPKGENKDQQSVIKPTSAGISSDILKKVAESRNEGESQVFQLNIWNDPVWDKAGMVTKHDGHALLLAIQKDGILFVDANRGVFSFKKMDDFEKWFKAFFENEYKGGMDKGYEVFQVTHQKLEKSNEENNSKKPLPDSRRHALVYQASTTPSIPLTSPVPTPAPIQNEVQTEIVKSKPK